MDTKEIETPITIYIAEWCTGCDEAISVCEELSIPYVTIDIDEDEDAAMLVEELNEGERTVPTIVFPDDSFISEPTREDLLGMLEDKGFILDTSEGNS